MPDILVNSLVTLDPAAGPLMLDLETSPTKFYFRLNLYQTPDSVVSIKSDVLAGGLHYPLDFTPATLIASSGLHCDMLVVALDAAAKEKFSVRLVFSQKGRRCVVTPDAVAAGTVDASGLQKIFFVCKFQ